jgi:hypothetical protein
MYEETRKMSEIKAIPTEYKGYLFRSRLEARWAVFLDAMGIEWEYEPEGFILSDGSYYLPDFYLTRFHCYFEVKRKSIKDTEEGNKAEANISDGSYTDRWAGLIAFGDPMDDDLRIFCQDTSEDTAGTYENPVTIGIHPVTQKPCLFSFEDCRERYFFDTFQSWREIPMVTRERGKYKYEDFINARVEGARKLARQARFEHGETPVVGR